jgi:hypothetical protein
LQPFGRSLNDPFGKKVVAISCFISVLIVSNDLHSLAEWDDIALAITASVGMLKTQKFPGKTIEVSVEAHGTTIPLFGN